MLKPIWLSDMQAVNRFKKEARTMAKLIHPNIAVIYEVGEAEGQVYLAQFLVDGDTLDGKLRKEGAMSWSDTMEILHLVASALDYAHSMNMIHRDIKPANILINKKGQAFLGDFGLVRAAESSDSISASTGGMVGTPAYMAPEQWEDRDITPATDVYALSCVVVEMLTGQMLFDGSTPATVMKQHLMEGPKFPAKWAEGVPEQIVEVLKRGLAEDPAERISKASDLVAELERAEEHRLGGTTVAPGTSEAVTSLPPAAAAEQPSVEVAAAEAVGTPVSGEDVGARAEPTPGSTPAAVAPVPAPTSWAEKIGGRGLAIIAGVVVLLIIVGGAAFFLGGRDDGPPPTTVSPTSAAAVVIADEEPTETASPTPEPTDTPQPTDTPEPTEAPVVEPTETPTSEPTATPSPVPEPTDTPTPEPTEAPATPTEEPAEAPSPTPEPTDTPTLEPTAVPTAGPTATPTVPAADISGHLAIPLVANNIPRVIIADTDGNQVSALESARQPSHTLDGTKLVVNGDGGPQLLLRVANSDGSGAREVGNPLLNAHSFPVWSNDGTQLLYIDRFGTQDFHLFSRGLDSTEGEGEEIFAVGNGQIFHSNPLYPLWTTQNRIIFRGCSTWDGQGGNCGVWLLKGQLGPVEKLTGEANHILSDATGNTVIFSWDQGGNRNVYKLDIASASTKQLTTDPAADSLGTISPDGNSVAFLSNRAGGLAIWYVSIDGGTPEKMFDIKSDWGALSPDGWTEEKLSWGK
jgi:serine/threonine-protein kinase